jgi:hypothetical protein
MHTIVTSPLSVLKRELAEDLKLRKLLAASHNSKDPIAESIIYESLGGSVRVGRKQKLNQNVDAHSPE